MIFWMAEVSNGFLSTGSMRSFICSPACLTVSSTAEPRLLINCTAPAKPALLSVSIRRTASWASRLTLRKTRSGGARPTCVSRNEPPSDEFDGVDAAALQDQRDELPDAAFFVDDEGERRAPLASSGRAGGIAGGGRGCCGHDGRAKSADTNVRHCCRIDRAGRSVNYRLWAALRCRYSGLPGAAWGGAAIKSAANHGFQHAFHESCRRSPSPAATATWSRSPARAGSSISPASWG